MPKHIKSTYKWVQLEQTSRITKGMGAVWKRVQSGFELDLGVSSSRLEGLSFGQDQLRKRCNLIQAF